MPHRRLPWAYRLARAVLRPLFMVLTERDWRGAEHLPSSGGFVACSNHVTYVDPLTFAHFLLDNGHPAYFLGKQEVFDVPLLGWLLRHAEQIPVHRETGDAAEAFRSAVAALDEGKCIAIFPEATLTRDPQMWPMVGKTGAARLALTTGCPVVPVAQWGPQEILGPYAKRLHLLPRKTMRALAGPPVDLGDLRGQPVTAALLAEATERIMRDITGLLEQLRGERGPAQRFDPRQHGLPRTGNPSKPARRRRAPRRSAQRVAA